MARGLVWSPEAVEDIESIARFIERDSVWHARAVASKSVETAQPSPDFPEMGRVVREVGDLAIRERFAYHYRIIYRVEQERILVAAVIHGRRLLDPIVQRIQGAA